MRQTSKVEGTKIAQAAKDLNVTSVTIRRYLSEFNIETATDENGIKVLPYQAMEELKTIRRLKEDGLTNPKVMELLEANRADNPGEPLAKTEIDPPARAPKAKATINEDAPASKRVSTRHKEDAVDEAENSQGEESLESKAPPEDAETEAEEANGEVSADQRPKHSLTCQTCGKVFEHLNPRLRDCLDCYRTKRKERRRGGSDRHKNVIQHPIAQQAATKAAQQSQNALVLPTNHENGEALLPLPSHLVAPPAPPPATNGFAPALPQRGQVRNYRKAIEETRQVTGSLKRRLERPDLPEGDRRWLEQIYAYQLILHQGWRHLSDYKNNTQTAKMEE